MIVDGNDPGVNGDVVEALLDLEVSGGLAPEPPRISTLPLTPTYSLASYLPSPGQLDDNAVSILNVSFGACEAFSGSSRQRVYRQPMGTGRRSRNYRSRSPLAIPGRPAATTSTALGGPVRPPSQWLGPQRPSILRSGGTDFDVLSTDFTKYVSATKPATYTSALGYVPETPWQRFNRREWAVVCKHPVQRFEWRNEHLRRHQEAQAVACHNIDSNGNLTACEPTTVVPSPVSPSPRGRQAAV